MIYREGICLPFNASIVEAPVWIPALYFLGWMKTIWVWFDCAFYCLLPHRNSGLILALLHAESQGLISALHWLGRTRVLSVVPQAQLRLDQQPEIPTASCLPSSEHGCSLAFSICCSVGVSQACSAVWFVPMGRCP